MLQIDPHHKEAAAALTKLDGMRSPKTSDPKPSPQNPRTAAEAFGQLPANGVKGIPGPAAWSQGLNSCQRHEWLVDCYRMRLDDDYAWGGCNLHGLYDPDHSPMSVMQDKPSDSSGVVLIL